MSSSDAAGPISKNHYISLKNATSLQCLHVKVQVISWVNSPIAPSKFVSPDSIDLIKFYRKKAFISKHGRNKN